MEWGEWCYQKSVDDCFLMPEMLELTMMYVFGRLMSQDAKANTQAGIDMCKFYNICAHLCAYCVLDCFTSFYYIYW